MNYFTISKDFFFQMIYRNIFFHGTHAAECLFIDENDFTLLILNVNDKISMAQSKWL